MEFVLMLMVLAVLVALNQLYNRLGMLVEQNYRLVNRVASLQKQLEELAADADAAPDSNITRWTMLN